MSEIVVVDDERSMRELLEIMLAGLGHSVRTAAGVEEALVLIADREPNLVITDLRMKGESGLDLLRRTRREHPEVEVIVITAFATDETAIEALKMGAYDYVTKPFQVEEIGVVIQRALERQRLLRQNVTMRAELSSRYHFENLIGRSPRMQEIYRLIEQVAPTRSNVLITGESGTGKELVARAIHFRSNRREEPFVPIDCGSIPEQLMESELFGYKRGAFTGAATDRKGLFELANGGTVFLDEIGELAPSLQVKLLRVIQERTLKRLGDGVDRQVDVRVVAATNRNLEEEVKTGRFREDLYYRLNVIRIHMPPLRERREDIPELLRHFVAKVGRECGARPTVLPDAVAVLSGYSFPGNVRELENMVERAVALSDGEPIAATLFLDAIGNEPAGATRDSRGAFPAAGCDLEALLAEEEIRWIRAALEAAGGVKKEAARLLGISFRSFRYRLQKLGLD